jgi:hypothetical protein
MALNFLNFRQSKPRSTKSERYDRVTDLVKQPLSPEEKGRNLTELESELNGKMNCPAGEKQVFILSLLTSKGALPPRIALKCPFRKRIGETEVVLYEHIRDVCCGDHESCPAYKAFQQRFVQT